MKIISASRRTDIPAFYTDWFMNRIRDGFCHSINPFGGQVYRVSLRPEDCLAIVFWTRNPTPLIRHLDFLRREGYRFYFHFTINDYPKFLESHSPPRHTVINAFKRLSNLISPEFTLWRYDPILFSKVTTESYHLEKFDSLSRQLEGYTNRCYFSFVDFYGKTERNLRRIEQEHNLSFHRPAIDEQKHLAHQLREIASARGITMYSCCHDNLIGYGIEKAHCIDANLVAQLRPDVKAHPHLSPTRQDCGCAKSFDIGSYDTCPYGCVYCYANNSRDAARKRMRSHDASDTVLWRPATMRGLDLTTMQRN